MLNRIGYVILAVGMVLGLYFARDYSKQINQERINRAKEVNTFLVAQCEREEFRDAIIIGALEDAKRRAEASITDPVRKKFEMDRLQASIEKLQSQINECMEDIPPVTVEEH